MACDERQIAHSKFGVYDLGSMFDMECVSQNRRGSQHTRVGFVQSVADRSREHKFVSVVGVAMAATLVRFSEDIKIIVVGFNLFLVIFNTSRAKQRVCDGL